MSIRAASYSQTPHCCSHRFRVMLSHHLCSYLYQLASTSTTPYLLHRVAATSLLRLELVLFMSPHTRRRVIAQPLLDSPLRPGSATFLDCRSVRHVRIYLPSRPGSMLLTRRRRLVRFAAPSLLVLTIGALQSTPQLFISSSSILTRRLDSSQYQNLSPLRFTTTISRV